MRTALVMSDPGLKNASLEIDLKRIGVHIVGATNCKELVRDAIRMAPDIVVVYTVQVDRELYTATAQLATLHPVAIVVFTEEVQVESMERALDAGITTWVVRGYRSERLRSVLQLTMLRFQRERRQQELRAELQSQLGERKLVDRAKGILMSAQGMAEDEAFRTLRGAAMHGKQRLGQVAQTLIEAARSAEATNRAGQLRMLSQRLVKLLLLESFDVEAHGAAALRQDSILRLEQNLAALPELLSAATYGDLLDATQLAWSGLRQSLPQEQQAPHLLNINAAGDELLEAAEHLTAVLGSGSTVARIQLVNLAGRQRMISQRVAKLTLLRPLVADPQKDAIASQVQIAIAAFDDAMQVLRGSAMTTAQDRSTLGEAQKDWATLCRCVDLVQSTQQRLQIAQTSEALLEHFDRLTQSYEHSLQVLIG